MGRKIKERKKVWAFFIDLKAAFDKQPLIERKVLWEMMRKRGIREELMDRVREIYEETRCIVRIGDRGIKGILGRERGKTKMLTESNSL